MYFFAPPRGQINDDKKVKTKKIELVARPGEYLSSHFDLGDAHVGLVEVIEVASLLFELDGHAFEVRHLSQHALVKGFPHTRVVDQLLDNV